MQLLYVYTLYCMYYNVSCNSEVVLCERVEWPALVKNIQKHEADYSSSFTFIAFICEKKSCANPHMQSFRDGQIFRKKQKEKFFLLTNIYWLIESGGGKIDSYVSLWSYVTSYFLWNQKCHDYENKNILLFYNLGMNCQHCFLIAPLFSWI